MLKLVAIIKSTVFIKCTAFVFVMAGSVWACQVPVFRYALERWNPDQYKMTILYGDETKSTAQQFANHLASRDSQKSQLDVELVHVDQANDLRWKEAWKIFGSKGDPVAVATYPAKATALKDQIAYLASIKKQSVEDITTSPARQEIASRLSSGDSAVWILLESGKAAEDDEAAKVLKSQLELDETWLKLPSAEELEVKPEVLEQLAIPLRIKFSIVRVKRDDPREQFLVQSLLGSESDLRSLGEPMAFPVFGRGLVLYALVGKGIAPDTIRAASSFVAGPCSCQVKEQNPGFDLLVNFDWDKSLGDVFVSQPIPGAGAAPKLLTIPPGRKSKQ
ncbi:MAG: hypothetical protein ABL921_11285 [Pirellula sp.]